MSYGSFMRQFRLQRNMPQKELAKILDIKDNSLIIIESGRRSPGEKVKERFENAFHFTRDEAEKYAEEIPDASSIKELRKLVVPVSSDNIENFVERQENALNQPTFGQVVKSLRELYGVSEEEVAKAVWYSPEYIRQLESGKIIPARQATELLCAYFGLSPEQETKAVNAMGPMLFKRIQAVTELDNSSVSKFAAKNGVTFSTITGLNTKTTTITPLLIHKISSLLNTTVEALLDPNVSDEEIYKHWKETEGNPALSTLKRKPRRKTSEPEATPASKPEPTPAPEEEIVSESVQTVSEPKPDSIDKLLDPAMRSQNKRLVELYIFDAIRALQSRDDYTEDDMRNFNAAVAQLTNPMR